MKIPIISGSKASTTPDYREALPVNMVPVPLTTGINEGYLRPAAGIVLLTTGVGSNRGGIFWRDVLWRVIGGSLCRISQAGTITVIGDITGTDQCRFTYGFDYLAIAADGKLWLFDGTTLTQVTDPDAGTVRDVVWIDGYYVITDGEFIAVTELNNPFAVNPLKYGAAEASPDRIVALHRIRNEVYVVGATSVEVFDNVGGEGFPFARIEGAQVQKGSVGPRASCVFMETLAFLGNGEGEAPAIYMATNGAAQKISTREIDLILSGYTRAQLATVTMGTQVWDGLSHLHVRLPDRTLVFDFATSQVFGRPSWFIYSTSIDGAGPWAAMDCILAYARWNVGHPDDGRIGYLDDSLSTHWGQPVGWEFTTPIVYNDGRGIVVHDLELVALPGHVAFGADPIISTSYSTDGVSWSQPKSIRSGQAGQRNKRLLWLQQGTVNHWRIQRFQGTSDAHLPVARLEARVEPLAW